MARRLGEILLEAGAITARDLDEALQTQLFLGVRAGTALVQYQMVPLSQVSRGLSIQHGVPTPRADRLLTIDRKVLEQVPSELCQRYSVLPFGFEGDSLCLAMRDPSREVAGEVSFAVKRPVKRFVVPELRLLYLLERHLDLPRPPRYLREHSPRHPRDERRTHVASTVKAEPLERPAGEPEVVTLDSRIVHTVEPATDLEAAIRAVRPLDLVLTRLRNAPSGESIVRLLVEPVLEGTRASILFFVREHHAIACCASGLSTTPERLQQLVVPLEPPSLMQWSVRMCSVLRGIADPIQFEIARYFGVEPPGEVCVAPVVPRGRVVNVVCVWSDRESSLGPDAPYLLGELAQAGAASYLELARRRRVR